LCLDLRIQFSELYRVLNPVSDLILSVTIWYGNQRDRLEECTQPFIARGGGGVPNGSSTKPWFTTASQLCIHLTCLGSNHDTTICALPGPVPPCYLQLGQQGCRSIDYWTAFLACTGSGSQVISDPQNRSSNASCRSFSCVGRKMLNTLRSFLFL